MNADCLFIYLCIFKFLSRMFYSLQCKHFALKFIPKYFILFDAIVNGSFLNFTFRLFIASAKKYNFCFAYCSCIMQSC